MKTLITIFLSLFVFAGQANAQTPGVNPHDSLETALLLPLRNVAEKEFVTMSNDSTNNEMMLEDPTCGGASIFGFKDFFACIVNTSGFTETISLEFKNITPEAEFSFEFLDSDTSTIYCTNLFEGAIFGVSDVLPNDTIYIRVFDVEFDQFDVGSFDVAAFSQNAPLPVVIEEYEIDKIDERSFTFYWSTASEINHSYYFIEHSSDGNNFEQLSSKIYSESNSTIGEEYSFSHTYPEYGYSEIMYYRLVSVDIDGSVEIFDILQLHYDIPEIVRVYYNEGTVLENFSNEETLAVYIYSMGGQLIRSFDLYAYESIRLDALGIADGIYAVNILDGRNLVYSDKISKE